MWQFQALGNIVSFDHYLSLLSVVCVFPPVCMLEPESRLRACSCMFAPFAMSWSRTSFGTERFSFHRRKCSPVMTSVTRVWLLSVKVLRTLTSCCQYQCIVGLSVLQQVVCVCVSCFEQEIIFSFTHGRCIYYVTIAC